MKSNLIQVVFFSLVGGVFSLIGGALLLARKNLAAKFAKYALPFAAGALLAAAFVDLIPDALHEIAHLSGHEAIEAFVLSISVAVMCGILAFFLLERAIHWFHHHKADGDAAHEKDARVPLIILGDTVHNFIDGVAIAAAFLVDPTTGIVVTLAVAAHEIPQEIGDFGLLLAKGMSRGKVLLANALSALATTVAAVTFFLIGSNVEIPLGVVLGLTAGFFIYIAVSDIIPAIHAREKKRFVGAQTALLVAGIVVVSLAIVTAHGVMHTEEEHSGHDHSITSAVEDRPLSDWANDWQSVEPYVKDGSLDEYFEHATENGEMSADDMRQQYLTMMKTDFASISITKNSISVGGEFANATYAGYKTITSEHGESVVYQFTTDGRGGVPKYWVFSDHYSSSKQAKQATGVPHVHAYYSNVSFDDIFSKATSGWATMYFVKAASVQDILAVFMAHSHSSEEDAEHEHEHEHEHE